MLPKMEDERNVATFIRDVADHESLSLVETQFKFLGRLFTIES